LPGVPSPAIAIDGAIELLGSTLAALLNRFGNISSMLAAIATDRAIDLIRLPNPALVYSSAAMIFFLQKKAGALLPAPAVLLPIKE
jgi:hypothetical protein